MQSIYVGAGACVQVWYLNASGTGWYEHHRLYADRYAAKTFGWSSQPNTTMLIARATYYHPTPDQPNGHPSIYSCPSIW